MPTASKGQALGGRVVERLTGLTRPSLGAGTRLLQDTVVALQALSLYGAVTYAKSGTASQVTLRSGGDFQQDFQVDPSNRLLLQRVPLPQVPGEYSAEVSGEGCVYLQVRVVEAGAVPGGEPLPRDSRSQGEDSKDKGEGRRVREGCGGGEKCCCVGEKEQEGQCWKCEGAVRREKREGWAGRRWSLSWAVHAHPRSHRAADSPPDEPEVQRAAHAGGRALHAPCVHHPRDLRGLPGPQGL